MENMTVGEIIKAVGGEVISGEESCYFSSVCIDSRKVSKGCLFIAIKGKRTDGHLFIEEAFAKGAACCIVEENVEKIGTIVKVSSTLRALAGLAAYYRNKFELPIVAVTGSVGKTTVKEMCASILSAKYNTLKSRGNLNSDIGMPLSVFDLSKENGAAVFEMGMSGRGEIKLMSQIAKPYVGIITNIGIAHIERLGNRENIFKAKQEITEGMDCDGILLLNYDDDILRGQKSKQIHTTYFYSAENKKADFYASDIKTDSLKTSFLLKTPFGNLDVKMHAVGIHNVSNAVAALAAGLCCGLTEKELSMGLLGFSSSDRRQDIIKKDDLTLIDDTYNASPDSMKAALSVLTSIAKARRIAVLSDMLELGDISDEQHSLLGTAIAENADILLCFGEKSLNYIEASQQNGIKEAKHFAEKEDCCKYLKSIIKEDDTILFKGSRGMNVDIVFNIIKEYVYDNNDNS